MGGREKLEGQVFGDFLAVEYIGNKKYKMVCNLCGEVKELYGANIKRGIGTVCSNKKISIDLTGQQIGEWYVNKYIGNKRYRCTCSCGAVKDVLKVNLLNGSSTSCGHSRNSYGDITHKQFGEWYVLEKAGYKWKCRCSCGKIAYHSSSDLVSGKTKSCGHGYNTFYDISGRKFGHWSVIEYSGNQRYLCECDCDNKTRKIIKKADLLRGATTSCGCSKSDKIRNTLLERYGEIAPNKISSSRTPEQIKAVESKEELKKFIVKLTDRLDNKPSSLRLAQELGLKLHRTLTLVHKYGLEDNIVIDSKDSFIEEELYEYIRSIYHGFIEQKNRDVLSGKELDIYIPEKKLAIEYNGDYWHSTIYKEKNYHQEKTIACARKSIRLVHIFEHEYIHNENKLKDFLKGLLTNDKQIIYARNTEVKEISSDIAQDFCEKYHLQGWSTSKICIGCYYNTDLVSVMTFSKPRFDTDSEYEIIRYCVKSGVNIIGGASKLFEYFISNYNPNSVITYSDISKFTGNIYTKLGFKVDKITAPNYVWVSNDLKNVFNRYQTQKHKLVEKGLGTDMETEDDIMYNIDFLKVYDAGNIKLYWNK